MDINNTSVFLDNSIADFVKPEGDTTAAKVPSKKDFAANTCWMASLPAGF